MSWIDDMNAMPEVAKVTQFQGRVKQNPAAVKKNKGNPFTNLVPTMAGSTGGALGGAAIGATAGSVVPIVGTVAGGLLGALIGGAAGGAGGKVVENKLEGNALGDDVGKEALISGLTSVGPGQLIKAGKVAKAGMGALKGSPAPTSLTSALDNVATVADEPLKTSRQGKLLDLGNKALISQYGTISKPVARATNPTKTIGELANYGITKPVDVERISGAVTGSNGIINKAVLTAVGGAGKVNTGGVKAVMEKALQANGVVEKDYKSVKQVVDAELKRLGTDADPKTTLSVMKSLEARIANLQGKGMNNRLTTPERTDQAQVLKAVRDELQEGLYKTAGANKNMAGVLTPEFREQLIKQQPNNPQWASFVDNKVMGSKTINELRSSMAPFVKGRQIIDEGDINAMTFGGRGGNLANQVSVGGLLNKVADVAGNVIKDPAARAASGVLRKAGGAGTPPVNPNSLQDALSGLSTIDKLKQAARQGVATQGPKRTLARNGVGQVADQAFLEPATADAEAMSQQMLDEYNQMPEVDPNAPQFLEPETTETAESDPNPFAPENATANIQKILANGGTMKDVTQYVSLVQALQELQPKAEETELSAGTKTKLAATANGEAALNQLAETFSAAGGGSGILGSVRNKLPGQLDPSAKLYNEQLQGMLPSILQALGKTDAPSETELKGIITALPKISDTPASAQKKLAALRKQIQAVKQNTLTYGAGGSDQTNLLSSLQGVQ